MAHKTNKLPFKIKDHPWALGALTELPCKYVVVWWTEGDAGKRIRSTCHRTALKARTKLGAQKALNRANKGYFDKIMGRTVKWAVYNVETGKKLKG